MKRSIERTKPQHAGCANDRKCRVLIPVFQACYQARASFKVDLLMCVARLPVAIPHVDIAKTMEGHLSAETFVQLRRELRHLLQIPLQR